MVTTETPLTLPMLLPLLEMSRDGLAVLDGELQIVYASPSGRALLDSCTGGLSAVDFLLEFALHERPYVHELIMTAAGGSWCTLRAVNGQEYAIEFETLPLRIEGAEYRALALRDLTEMRRERAAQESQRLEKDAQYRSIFESTSDGLAITRMDGLVVEANPAMCRMHGYEYDELIGLHPTAFIHPDYHERFREHLQTVRSGGSYWAQSVEVRKDGTPFHVEVAGTVFLYKGEPHRLAVLRDITERVEAYELLEKRVAERTRELSTLLEVSHTVASMLDLQPLLDLIVDQLKVVAPYSGAALFFVEEDRLVVQVRRTPGPDPHAGPGYYWLPDAQPLWHYLREGNPLIIDDVRGDTPEARAYQASVGEHLESSFGYERAWLAVPMLVRDRVIGVLSLSSSEPGHFTAHHAGLARAIAQQASTAIENARLYKKAQEGAVLAERQRLARELHDSVSQALFGIGLGTQTARSLVEHDPARAIAPLDYVVSLAKTGMAEMRALIFELRPESLEEEGLVTALQKQTQALAARHEIPVEMNACPEPSVPLQVKEALYRIAQEALHNVFKHTRPTRVALRLHVSEGEFVLEVEDDGAGFDTGGSFPGHLGLRSMRERMSRLGGKLEVRSAVGSGTLISAHVPATSDR